jgi:hypothetical protein
MKYVSTRRDHVQATSKDACNPCVLVLGCKYRYLEDLTADGAVDTPRGALLLIAIVT